MFSLMTSVSDIPTFVSSPCPPAECALIRPETQGPCLLEGHVLSLGAMLGRHEDRLVGLARDLVDRGREQHIVLSHDVGVVPELRYHGGRGFTYLAESFLPKLRAAGSPDSTIATITVDNPKRLLAMPD
jgi:hypothetical protein